jgi:hypothetical protein
MIFQKIGLWPQWELTSLEVTSFVSIRGLPLGLLPLPLPVVFSDPALANERFLDERSSPECKLLITQLAF